MGMRETWDWESHGNEKHMGHLKRLYSCNAIKQYSPLILFYSHVSLIPMSLSLLCLSRSHISLTIPLVMKVLLTSGASGIGTHVKAQIDSTHIGSLNC